MKKLIVFAKCLLVSCVLYGQDPFPAQTDQVIIRFRNDFNLNESSKSVLKTGAREVDRIIASNGVVGMRKLNVGEKAGYTAVVLKFPSGTDIEKILNDLSNEPDVVYAEPDFIGHGGGEQGVSPDDQYYSRQWGLRNDGSFPGFASKAGADIEMEEGWAIEQGDSSIVVGIIDSGCKLDHPEFQNRIWHNYAEIPGNGIDEDKNGYVDDSAGWDFANQDNDPTDDYGHGTNVTGIIGANGNNGIGYAGVDWNCKLMILKGLNNQNSGYYSWWSDAIHYAVDNGAKVINMSVGGSSVSSTLKDAVNYALNHNVTIVACMMNTNSNTLFYPAAYPGVIAVGSTNPDDKRSNPFFWSTTSGSNYGSHISVVAPGNFIYGLSYMSNTNYGTYWGGTSQATPLVTGLSALILAQNPALTPTQIKSVVQATAEDQVGDPSEDTYGWDQYYGFGRINAHNALLLLSGYNQREQADKRLTIYPNPNKGIVNIILPSLSPGKAIATITNYLGQTVYDENIEDQKSSFSISPVPGLYIVKVKYGNTELSGKFIIL